MVNITKEKLEIDNELKKKIMENTLRKQAKA